MILDGDSNLTLLIPESIPGHVYEWFLELGSLFIFFGTLAWDVRMPSIYWSRATITALPSGPLGGCCCCPSHVGRMVVCLSATRETVSRGLVFDMGFWLSNSDSYLFLWNLFLFELECRLKWIVICSKYTAHGSMMLSLKPFTAYAMKTIDLLCPGKQDPCDVSHFHRQKIS